MKKLLSFVLVLALVLGSFSMAFAVPADVAGTDYEDAVTALSELGVVTGYTDGKYYPEKAVNRAEAAKLVITALGLGEYAGGNNASFTDLEGYGWAKGYIGYAEALGILKGDGNGKFRPADPVSYEEMATMLVRAIGYTDASLPGTWPANYVVKAKALGLMDGIAQAGDADANRGDVAVMLYNALEVAIGTVDAENQWNANDPADTMLARLDRAEYLGGAAFVLTEDAPVADGVNVKAYYGAYVVAYENSDHEITGIKEVKSTFLTGEMDGTKFVANDVEYTITGDNFDGQVYVFENGETAASATAGAFSAGTDEYTIAAKISGKKITTIYSEATWSGNDIKITKNMVKAIDEDNKINNANKFVEDDNYEIDTTAFILLGVDSVADIAEDDIVTTYVNANNFITKIEVTDEVVTGEITKKSADDAKITVNGKVYEHATADFASYDAGDEVELTLNYGGYVYAIEKVSGDLENYGIVTATKATTDDWSGSTTEYAIKFFSTAGEEVTAALDEDITDQAINLTDGVVFKYDMNKDGELADTTVAAFTGTLTDAKVSAKGVVAGYDLTDNTIVVIVDSLTTSTAIVNGDADDYSIGKAADLYDAEITAGLFVADTDTDEVTFIIVQSDSTSSDDVYAVVNEAWTDNSDAGYGATLIIEGVETAVAADKLASVVTTSALKTVAYNTDGTLNVDGMDVASPDYTANTSGNAITVENNRIKVDGTAKGLVSEDIIVYVWDDENGVWTVGDTSDVEIDLVTGDFVELYKLDSDNENEITHVLVYQL